MAAITMPTLKLGSTGPHVNELQRLLTKVGAWQAGWWGNIDKNIFGPMTLTGVQYFQKLAGVPVTGVVDDRSWTAFYVRAGEARIVSGSLATAQHTGSSGELPAITNVNSGQGGLPTIDDPGSGVFLKLVLLGGFVGAAWYLRKMLSGGRKAGGMAVLDDGYDNAGPAIQGSKRLAGSSRRKKPVKRAKEKSSWREGTTTVGPQRSHGRNAWRTMRDEETGDEVELIDPGKPPKVLRLEADERLYKAQKHYREDMKRLAWDRAQANDTRVDVVARGTIRKLYSADPAKR